MVDIFVMTMWNMKRWYSVIECENDVWTELRDTKFIDSYVIVVQRVTDL